MTLRMDEFLSVDLESNKGHERGRVEAVSGIQSFRYDVAARQSADAELYMLGDMKIVDVAERELGRREDRHRLDMTKQLVLVHPLGPPEDRVGVLENRRAFEQKAVERMAGLVHLAAPGEGGRPIIPVAERL